MMRVRLKQIRMGSTFMTSNSILLAILLVIFLQVGSIQNSTIFRDVHNTISILSTSPTRRDSPCNISGMTVNCTGQNLSHINSTWFPMNTEVILLNDNNLASLENSTFSHLAHLIRLDLSNNILSLIEPLAFEGLTELNNLSLRNNEINFPVVFENVFEPLRNLKQLDVRQKLSTTNQCDVPGGLLRPLSQLRNLSISSCNYTLYLERDFLELKNLEVLEITGTTQNISDISFENIDSVNELVLKEMKILKVMSENVFFPLQNLTILKMTNVSVDVQNVSALLWPFRGRNMSHIYFNALTSLPLPNPMKNGFLTKTFFSNLLDICLQTFSIINCNLYYITADAIDNRTTWSTCLRNVILSDNPLMGSSLALLPLGLLKNLETVVINNAARPCYTFSKFPEIFKCENLKRCWNFRISQSDQIELENKALTSDTDTILEEINRFEKNLTFFLNGTIFISISTFLKSVDVRRLVYYQTLIYNITIKGADNINFLDISDSGFFSFVGNIQGLSALQTAIFSGNNMHEFSESFFDGFSGLINLALSTCQLNGDFFAVKSDRIFKSLFKLRELDLSYNSLNSLSKGTFSHNSELTNLILSGNQFKDIPFDLKSTPKLKQLNMSYNAITSLTQETRRSLDILATKNDSFMIILKGNILSCACADLPFLQWINFSSVNFDQERNYTCINKDGVKTYMMAYADLDSLWRECWGEFFLSVALITMCLYVIGVFVIFLLIKNKNYVISYFLQLLGNFRLHTRFDYNTNVYIGYSDYDYQFPCTELREHLEENLKLSTFLIDRDLLACLDKASGIMNAINSCWKILLVCSESFLKDEEWSMFTIRSAMYAQTPSNPARIVVMVHRKFFSLLPTELLSVVNDENIIVLSEWTIDYTVSEKLRTRLMA